MFFDKLSGMAERGLGQKKALIPNGSRAMG